MRKPSSFAQPTCDAKFQDLKRQESKINMRGQNDLESWIEKQFPNDTKRQQAVAAAYQVGKGFDTANNAITQISTDMGTGCVCTPLSKPISHPY
jgi:hypothetical protein